MSDTEESLSKYLLKKIRGKAAKKKKKKNVLEVDSGNRLPLFET